MFPPSSVGDIAHVIQLAIAPVFLLTGVGTLLAVLSNRLGRAVDRGRVVEKLLPGLAGEALFRAAPSSSTPRSCLPWGARFSYAC